MFSAISGHKEFFTPLDKQQHFFPPDPSHISRLFLGDLPVSGTGTFSVTAAVSLCLELHEPDELLAFGSELNQKILLYVRTTITLVYFTHSNVFSLSLSPHSNLLIAATQQFFNFRGNLRTNKKWFPITKFRSVFDLPNEQVLSPKEKPDVNSQILPGQWAVCLFRWASTLLRPQR